jgi:hypothetical protein
MKSRSRIDRKRRDSDVVEHVVEGLRTECTGAHPRVTDGSVYTGLVGQIVSATRVEVIGARDEKER